MSEGGKLHFVALPVGRLIGLITGEFLFLQHEVDGLSIQDREIKKSRADGPPSINLGPKGIQTARQFGSTVATTVQILSSSSCLLSQSRKVYS